MSKAACVSIGVLAGAFVAAVVLTGMDQRAAAQDPAKAMPQMYKIILENDHVRVVDYRIHPGEKEPVHSHPEGVVVYFFSDAKVRTTMPNGKTVDSFNKAGEVLWRDPVTHAGQNIGDSEIHALLVEPKNSAKE